MKITKYKKISSMVVAFIIFVVIALSVFEAGVIRTKARAKTKLLYANKAIATATDADNQDADRATLYLDSQNKYSGMTCSYEEGYIPIVANNQVTIVYPMLTEGNIRRNSLQTKLELGDSQTAPFVFKNYERVVRLQSVKVNDDTKEIQAYVADFTIELKEKRMNGSYPVVLKVSGKDIAGNDIIQEFTIYVTITDGINPNEEPAAEEVTEEQPVFAPKMMVESYTYSKEQIYPGDTITAKIVLKNTSRDNQVKNMTVSISAENDNFILLSNSDSVYVDCVKAQETYTVSFDYQIGANVASGQYDLELAMDYADGDGNTYTAGGKAKLDIAQEAKVQFDPLLIPNEAVVADVVEARVQAMNLGRSKVFNVRAVLLGDGLTPEGTVFIGEMEPGSIMSATTQVSVSSLSGDNLYGQTDGVITYYYEDEDGKEYQKEAAFSVMIQSPFSDSESVMEDNTNQWGVIMAAIGICILACVVILAVRKIKNKRLQD